MDERQRFFHVSSALNRDSILAHGLDWSRMGAARGIAGNRSPEAEGAFLARDASEADYFTRLNNTGGPVDVWEVRGVDAGALVGNGNGYDYLPGTVAAHRLSLVRLERVYGTVPGHPSAVQIRVSQLEPS